LRIDTERLERLAPAALAVAMAAAAAVIVWASRDTTMTIDELVWFMESDGLDPDAALQPHGGHLTLAARVLYAAVFDAFGAGYLPFRLFAAGSVLLTAGLFFVFAGRHVGRLAAIGPTLVLLFFGSDSLHLLTGNAFTIHLALSCGIGALLLVERGDLRGDLGACLLLVLGLTAYTVTLGFLVGVAVLLVAQGRARRLWVPAVPLALYAAWWIWSLGASTNAESAVVLSNVLLFPAASFQALGAVLSGLLGLNYPFGGAVAQIGPTVVLLAVAALVWRLHRRGPTPMLVAVIAIPLVLWAMISVAKFRGPTDPRYLYPGAVAVLLVAAAAAAGFRLSRFALGVLLALSLAGLATNAAIARDTARDLRDTYTPQVRSELAAIEISRERVSPEFDPGRIPGFESPLLLPFAEVRARGEPPTAAYLEAVDAFGSPAYTPAELEARDEGTRARADRVLVAAYELRLSPAAPGGGCRRAGPAGRGTVSVELPPEGAVLQARSPAPVAVRRFADLAAVRLGELDPGRPAMLRIPADGAERTWSLALPASVSVCRPA
jgi:hypothetical protein